MTKYTRTIVYLCVLLGTGLVSCKKDWLEIKSDASQAVPTRLKDFQALMAGATNNNSYSLGEVAADGHYITPEAWNTANNTARNAYTWSNTVPYTNSAFPCWEFTFRRIFFFNLVIDGIDNAISLGLDDKQEFEKVRGQALLRRSEAFWTLSQLFSEPYNASTAATKMGIPLKLNSDITEVSERSTVKETFEQIISDLILAEELLPDLAIVPTQGDKCSVYGLLARIYLVMRDYDKALLYCQKSLTIKDGLLDFNSISATATSIGSTFSNPLLNTEIIFFHRLYTSDLSNVLSSQYLVDPDFYSLYQSNDLRKNRFFRINLNNGAINFKGNYNNSSSSWFSGIATDEMYLIKAECLARTGDVANAMNTLNFLLRKRHDSTFTDYSVNTQEEALNTILTERRKELVLRNLRWSDLRRLGGEDQLGITITRTIDGKTYVLKPGSFEYTFPIPQDIINISGIPQTSGW